MTKTNVPTLTRNKGKSTEKKIPLSTVMVPDLWHIAQAELDLNCRWKVLETWHLAHDLLNELRAKAETHAALVEALKAFIDASYEQAPTALAERIDKARVFAIDALRAAGEVV